MGERLQRRYNSKMDIDYRPLNKNDKWSEILMGKYLKTKNSIDKSSSKTHKLRE